jgi:hypothetical protein
MSTKELMKNSVEWYIVGKQARLPRSTYVKVNNFCYCKLNK